MKFISKFALALSLSAITVVPAYAAKKDQKPKEAATESAAPKLKLSKPFIAAYAPAVDMLQKKKDPAAAKAALPGVIAAATSEDDKYEAGIFAYTIGSELKDVALQRQGLDMLLASPIATQDKKATFQFQRAAYSYDAKDYASAVADMNKAYDLGYRKADIELLTANSYGQLKRYPEAITWMRKFLDASKAAGKPVEGNTYAVAANYALKSKDFASANVFLKDLVRVDGTSSNWHDSLNILMRSRNFQLAELLDIYRLMRATNSLNYEQEYAGYSESADPRRYPAEVAAVINEGMAKGTVTKTNRNFTDALQTANSILAEDKRTLGSSETAAKSAANGYQAALSGDALISHNEFARAKAMYELALTKGNIRDREGADQTDRVYMRLAMVKIGLGDMAGAKSELAKIKGENRKAIADYWLIHADQKMAPKPAA